MDDENKVMTKVVLGFVALVTVGAALLYAVAPAKSEELLSDIKLTQMVVPSIQLNKNCSGTIIHSDRDKESGEAETFILTAKHCTDAVDQKMDINIAEYNPENRKTSETAWKGFVLGQSYKSDLALIKLYDKQKVFVHTAEIADKTVKLAFGQTVYSVSFPMGFSKTFTAGNLGFVENMAELSDVSKSSDFYRATPDIAGGSSGSALFTEVTKDKVPSYQLIGVLTAGFTRGTFMNLYTPIDEIVEYISTASKSWKTAVKVEKKDEVKKEVEKKFDDTNTWERAN